MFQDRRQYTGLLRVLEVGETSPGRTRKTLQVPECSPRLLQCPRAFPSVLVRARTCFPQSDRRRRQGYWYPRTHRAWRSSRVQRALPLVPSFSPRRMRARCLSAARRISERRLTRSSSASTRKPDREIPRSTARCLAARRTSLGIERVTFCFSTYLRVTR